MDTKLSDDEILANAVVLFVAGTGNGGLGSR